MPSRFFFFFNATATTEIYTLSLHGRSSDLSSVARAQLRPRRGHRIQPRGRLARQRGDRRADAARSEEHTSELQSQSNLVCRLLLEKKKNKNFHSNKLINPFIRTTSYTTIIK